MIHTPTIKKYVGTTIILLTISLGIIFRLLIFNEEGGDHITYKTAVLDFCNGINPYTYTVESFEDKTLEHGYAYFPTLLYILSAFWEINVLTQANIPTALMWKIPVLFADLGVVFLLYKYFKKRDLLAGAFIIAFWFLNPYFTTRYEYCLFDHIQVFFLFLSLTWLGKKDYLTGVSYALAVSMKTIPGILFSLFLLKSKDWRKFLLAASTTVVLISTPFLTSRENISTYVKGALLVHESRSIQGRPILSFITYHLQDYGINFLQTKYTSIYAYAALSIPFLTITYLLIKDRNSNKFKLSALGFTLYYLLTPVFNRTHLLWGLPFILITIYELLKNKKKYFYLGLVSLYIVTAIYLSVWYKGFETSKNSVNRVYMGNIKNLEGILPLKTKMRNLYYEYRHKYREILGK